MWDEIHSASGQSNLFLQEPRIFTHTEFFFSAVKNKTKKRLPGHSSNPDAHFRSPVNGLESSALLLQFNTVLMYIYIFTSSTLILFKITRVIISNHRRTNNKRWWCWSWWSDWWDLKTDFPLQPYVQIEFINKALEPFFKSPVYCRTKKGRFVILFHRASVRGVHDSRFSNTVFKLGSLEATDAELGWSNYAYKNMYSRLMDLSMN